MTFVLSPGFRRQTIRRKPGFVCHLAVQRCALLLLFLLAGCLYSGGEAGSVKVSETMTFGDLSSERLAELETRVVLALNGERQRRGLPALQVDERLAAAARAHSLAMAEQRFFDHTGPDGSQPGERILAQGYRWRFCAENLACGHRSAETVVANWMESREHHANVLNAKAVDVGVGLFVREGTDCTFYWTVVFAAER